MRLMARASSRRATGEGSSSATRRRRTFFLVAATALAALVVAPLAFENAGDPDSTTASWQYVSGNSGPVRVTVDGTWSWGDNSIPGGGKDSQSCYPSNPVSGYNDVNGHWAVGIAVSWNDSSTPNVLTGKATDGSNVTLHVGNAMDWTNPNYCAGTTAAAPYPSGTFSASHTYNSLAEFLADTNNGQVCANAYDVHKPNDAKEGDPSQNGDNTLHNGHYSLSIDCSAARNANVTSVSTALSATTVAVGTGVRDGATLSGTTPNAGGTVAYTVYPSQADCNAGTNGTSEGTVTVSNNTVPNSNTFTPTSAGSYYWRAVYSGDGNNNGASSDCASELLTVNPLGPAITTSLVPATITLGESARDTATLSGTTANAGGRVTYTVYPSVNDCSHGTNGTAEGTVTVTNGSVPNSSTYTPSSAGTYYWQAVYSGDANNKGTSSGCSSEPFTVNPPGTPPSPPPSPPSPPPTPPSPPPTPPSPPTPPPSSPAIAITKNPKQQTIGSGSTATFAILVTNIGNVTLTNVTVSDPLSPNCNRTSATLPGLASMAPGASVTYSCSRPKVTTGFTNVATAKGTPPSGPNVSASDSAPVTVSKPFTPPRAPAAVKANARIGIGKSPKVQTLATTIVKTRTYTTSHYATAHFTISVKNLGNVRLTNVTVTDALSPGCNRSLGTLAPGAARTYTCSKPSVTRNFTNLAVATGKPPKGPKVRASDTAVVKVTFKTVSTVPAKYTG
jgi:uncharacterized repeat protein (TIGR01451 family)